MIQVCFCLLISMYLSISLPLSLSLHLEIYLSVHRSIHITQNPYIHTSLHTHICPLIHPSIESINPSICPSFHSFFHCLSDLTIVLPSRFFVCHPSIYYPSFFLSVDGQLYLPTSKGKLSITDVFSYLHINIILFKACINVTIAWRRKFINKAWRKTRFCSALAAAPNFDVSASYPFMSVTLHNGKGPNKPPCNVTEVSSQRLLFP